MKNPDLNENDKEKRRPTEKSPSLLKSETVIISRLQMSKKIAKERVKGIKKMSGNLISGNGIPVTVS